MAQVTAAMVKELRGMTNLAMMECKTALVEADGDMDKAVEILRKRGAIKSAKRQNKEAAEGCIECYLHTNGKLAALVELRCETDFVARNEDFHRLAKDICMHVAAMEPQFLDSSSVDEKTLAQEKAIYADQVQGKPENIVEKILEGKLKDFYKRTCLLDQPFVKDDSKTIRDLLAEQIHKMGENIYIARYQRLELGGQ
jgi:elongation factor Ts